MKKTQKQWIAVVVLSVLIGIALIGQAGGGPQIPPKVAPKTPALVASARPVQTLEEPVIARDAFWNPGLLEKQPEAKVAPSAPAKLLPQPSFEPTPASWIPPVRPDTTQLEEVREPKKEEAAPVKESPPKKLLRVCGFMTTSQTPTIMLSLNGEDLKTCKSTDRPWPNVTVLKVDLDRATLKIADKKIVVMAGQEVRI